MTSPTTHSPTESKSSINADIPQDIEKTAPVTDIAKEDELSPFGPAPDGGARAWVTTAGGFCIFFGCLGFTSCFGVLQQYYTTHQLRHRTADEVAWIGSVSSFIQFGGGAIGGPMFDRYGVWVNFFA
jgi:hypothetical protein